MTFKHAIMMASSLFASTMYAMDNNNDSFSQEERIVHNCEIDKIMKISSTSLVERPGTFFYAALQCPNSKDILEIFNLKTRSNKPGSETFAHHVNKQAPKENSFTGNYYLDTLIKKGKFK